jgi:hypothetical protein
VFRAILDVLEEHANPDVPTFAVLEDLFPPLLEWLSFLESTFMWLICIICYLLDRVRFVNRLRFHPPFTLTCTLGEYAAIHVLRRRNDAAHTRSWFAWMLPRSSILSIVSLQCLAPLCRVSPQASQSSW